MQLAEICQLTSFLKMLVGGVAPRFGAGCAYLACMLMSMYVASAQGEIAVLPRDVYHSYYMLPLNNSLALHTYSHSLASCRALRRAAVEASGSHSKEDGPQLFLEVQSWHSWTRVSSKSSAGPRSGAGWQPDCCCSHDGFKPSSKRE